MGCGLREAGILAAALQFDIEMRFLLIHDSKALSASQETFSSFADRNRQMSYAGSGRGLSVNESASKNTVSSETDL
jgi:hypothetical protein